MPPEQISGKEVTRATDVYAACVVLWETLTCRRLFAGSHDGEIVHRVLEGRVPPPSKLRPDVPRALDQIVLRGLNRNPAERFQTAEAMIEALEHVAPPVTRSTVSKWLMESAAEEIRRREQCLARVESSITTPAFSAPPPPSTATPAAPANGDSTVSTVGTLSHSLIHDIPQTSRGSRRKRFVLAAGAVTLLGLGALTPMILRKLAAADQKAAIASDAPRSPGAQAEPPLKPAEPPTPAPATTSTASAADPVVTAAPEASSTPTTRKRATVQSSPKRPRGKEGAFDRIYKRD
jgi:serine/threonine-protein kinase